MPRRSMSLERRGCRSIALPEVPSGRSGLMCLGVTKVPEFELSSEKRDDAAVIRLIGDLDIVTSRQLDETLAASRRTLDRVVLDLSAVDFMDTSSLAVIVSHWKGLVASGGMLALAGARFQYTRTLWITGLADRIPMYDTVDLAIAGQRAAAGDGAG
jgi:anti-sigma B factor antagonist